MKKRIFFFIIINYFSLLEGQESAVTYTLSGGRFGDNLIAYCHAKWISYFYKIPLLYIPFELSDQLMMHQLEIHYNKDIERKYKKVVSYQEMGGHIDQKIGYLYVVPFFSEFVVERFTPNFPFLFHVDWKDEGFKKDLRKMIQLMNPIELPTFPADHITIAIHIRRGAYDIPGYATSYEKLTDVHPLRWPPNSFYINQIKQILNFFPDKKIYIRLFTDYVNPLELVTVFKQAINNDKVIFDCDIAANIENPLHDFFSMMQFDCLIRANSNFSLMATKIADFKIIISPWTFSNKDNKSKITEIITETFINNNYTVTINEEEYYCSVLQDRYISF
jgi:hypothetical protein